MRYAAFTEVFSQMRKYKLMKPSKAEDIMVRNVITCRPDDSLAHARSLMKQHSVRHVPVVDANGELKGLVTQKSVLRETFLIASHFGMSELEYQEGKKLVADIMETAVETIQPQLPLLEAGRYFLECKHGCLPVVEDGKVVGILTSADFVKLSIRLLEG